MSEELKACVNTDKEIWRGPDEGNGSYYADSLHITKDGGLGIDCYGLVRVRPIREWHRLAAAGEQKPCASEPPCFTHATTSGVTGSYAAPQPAPGWDEAIEAMETEIVRLTQKWGNPCGTDYEQGMQDHGNRLLAAVKALRSSQSTSDAGGGARVKPLEWISCEDGTYHDIECRYEITAVGKFFRLVRASMGGASYCCDADSVEACKETAQYDHEKRIRSALSNPAAADSNASAEARLREALARAKGRLTWAANADPGVRMPEGRALVLSWADEIEDAISPAPHASDCEKQQREQAIWDELASDCDKQGEQVTDGSMQSGDIISYEADEKTGVGKVTSHYRPSGRPADVTDRELSHFLYDRLGGSIVSRQGHTDDVAQAILEAFTVGRR